MNFFSLEFIVFLGACVAIYYIFPGKNRWFALLLASVFFYVYSAGTWAFVFIFTTALTTYLGGRLIEFFNAWYQKKVKNAGEEFTREDKKRLKKKTDLKKRVVFLLVLLLNLGFLIVLKYGDFLAENINGLLAQVSFTRGNAIPVPDFILPLGISFYTLQSLGYLIDVYRGKYECERNPLKHLLFVTWFPQVIQGPINRCDVMRRTLYEGAAWDEMRIQKAILRILWGYLKKIVVAERAAIFVDKVLPNTLTYNFQGLVVFIAALLYGVQIYADFSGGMDIVFGVSELFGIEMTENFNQPYLAKSVAEFWKRWHITLGHWMRDYVFYSIAFSRPFGSLQKKMKKKYGPYIGKVFPSFLASFIVFMLVGLWHGAAWKYIVYGTYHAIFVSSATLLEAPYEKMRNLLHIRAESFGWKCFQIIRTVVIITLGRYFILARSVSEGFGFWRNTFARWNPWVLTDTTMYSFGLTRRNIDLLMLCIITMFLVDVLNEKGIRVRDHLARQGIVFRYIIYLAAIMVILIYGIYGPGYDAGAFIYQQF